MTLMDCALSPRTSAPDFTLSSYHDRTRLLSDLRGQTIVLAFFPNGWDPARSEQLAQYNAILAGLPGLNAELLDLSGDGLYRNLAFAEEQFQVPFITQAAPEGAVAEMYGVAGRNALFVIDAEGIIRWRYVAPVGAAPRAEDLLTALRSISPTPHHFSVTRREFVAATLAAAFALALPWQAARADDTSPSSGLPDQRTTELETMPITLTVNGRPQTVALEPRVTLLDALRERLSLTGTKKGCDHGQCGACTVHIDGRRVLSCLTLAMSCQGKQITTIEGLASGDQLHPVQAAFIKHDAFQCGYCTSGQIMSADALLREPVGAGRCRRA